ncbi:MAG TPA: SDR family oxidoreductase [Ktedonobacterales bacterium]|jgi:uncharacterized protein YbjT (DUF2867 family)|nr:SDR family oxidoreductase [Ktedonobacterales bacterium]
MILIAGGTGLLGTQVVRLLSARGLSVRVLTRDPRRAQHLSGDHVETVVGAVNDRDALERAMTGTRVVISAIHGFSGTGDANPRTVDLQGNKALIAAACRAGVEHFVLLSIHGAAADHPIELFRMKYAAEQAVRASGLAWTIIRPTAYMETWASLIGEPLLKTGKTRIFGSGANPINFVSAHDVAHYVAGAVQEPAMRGEGIEVGGPENLSMRQMAEAIMRVRQVRGTVSAVPLPMMRLMAVAMRPVNATLARQIQAGIVMDTKDMSFDPTEMRRRYPSMPYTRLEEVIRRDVTERVSTSRVGM